MEIIQLLLLLNTKDAITTLIILYIFTCQNCPSSSLSSSSGSHPHLFFLILGWPFPLSYSVFIQLNSCKTGCVLCKSKAKTLALRVSQSFINAQKSSKFLLGDRNRLDVTCGRSSCYRSLLGDRGRCYRRSTQIHSVIKWCLQHQSY